MTDLLHIFSSPAEQWIEKAAPATGSGIPMLKINGETLQTWKGFGGCFNELGEIALRHLSDADRKEVMNELFTDEACGFNYCRLPIGANDYAKSWYSHNEHEGDFAMEHFSIARDHEYILPYLKEALSYRDDMFLFASPWSPPTWLKFPQAHNHGRIIWEENVLKTYAKYFVRFVEEYAKEGIRIDAVHVQNEPDSDQKFPSCCWTGETLRDFIRDYIGPAFEKVDCDVWLGTIERPQYNNWVFPTLSDPNALKYTAGVGFQWGGKFAVQRTHEAFPNLPLIQTENECGNGDNDWWHAHHVFDLIQHYIANGVEAYTYWNMVLEPRGISTWGWPQNAMITVDPETNTFTRNPEFYVMKHAAAFVKRGAQVLGLEGPWSGNALAFKNPDGSTAWIIQNRSEEERSVTVEIGGEILELALDPLSITTLFQ